MNKVHQRFEPSTRHGRAPADVAESSPRKSARTEPERPVSVRFTPDMLARLDRVAMQLSQVNVNIRVGRSSVIKLAMDRALLMLEAELSARLDRRQTESVVPTP